MDLKIPNGIVGILLVSLVAHSPASAADIPKKAPAAVPPKAEPIDEWTRSFLRDSTITMHFRSYYLERESVPPPGPAAFAAGGWLGYQSGWLGNVMRVGVVGYTSQPVWAPEHRDGTLLLRPEQKSIGVLGEAYVQLKLQDQVFTGYRQRMNEPEVNPRDIRMIPNTFEGYTLAGKFGDFGYTAAYLTEIKPINSDRFINFATQAGAPLAVSESLWLGTVSYNPVKDFTVRLSNYHVPDILTSTYTDVVWLTPLSDAYKLRIGGQFMYQGSAGDNKLTGSSFDTWAGGAKADLIWGPITLSTAYNQTDSGAFYRSPYGSWAGYTSMIVKDFNRAGERALLVGVAYDFAAMNIPGLSFFTNAVFGRHAIDPIKGTRLSDNDEYDFTLDYRFTASYWPEYLKPLWIRGRAVYIDERLNNNTNVTNDYRIIVNYEWVFKYN